MATSKDMIAILAHRGFWTEPAEKNSREALERAFREGFGIETDIRDRNGALVVSHDPPVGDGLMTFDELLELYRRHAPQAGGRAGTLALNIKADGLQGPLLDALARHSVDDWFVFDMAVPDGVLICAEVPSPTPGRASMSGSRPSTSGRPASGSTPSRATGSTPP